MQSTVFKVHYRRCECNVKLKLKMDSKKILTMVIREDFCHEDLLQCPPFHLLSDGEGVGVDLDEYSMLS